MALLPTPAATVLNAVFHHPVSHPDTFLLDMLVVLLISQKDYVLRGVVSQVSQVEWAGFSRKASSVRSPYDCGLPMPFGLCPNNSIPLGTPYGGGKQIPLGQVVHRRFYLPRRYAHIG